MRIVVGVFLLLRMFGASIAEYTAPETLVDGWASYGVNRSIRLVFGDDQTGPNAGQLGLFDTPQMRRATSAACG